MAEPPPVTPGAAARLGRGAAQGRRPADPDGPPGRSFAWVPEAAHGPTGLASGRGRMMVERIASRERSAIPAPHEEYQMSRKTKVGSVTWGENLATAVLFDDETWSVTVGGREIPGLAASMANFYADAYAGPQDGPYGRKILFELAERMKGTLILEDGPPPDYFVTY
jgi:hypothetical protein